MDSVLTISQPASARASIERFSLLLTTPHHAFRGAHAHNLVLAGLILIPSLTYPSGPLATLSPNLWSDHLNTRLLAPVTLTQLFLPLLTRLPTPPRLLILTPAIIPALMPPFHSLETTLTSALDAYTTTLRSELSPLGISCVSLKLGTFDFSPVASRQALQTLRGEKSSVLGWSDDARATYGRNFRSQADGGVGAVRGCGQSGGRGSPLRELHNAVFDAVTEKRVASVVWVGQGSRVYGLVGRWVPAGIVGWMMGVRKVEKVEGVDEEKGNAGVAGSAGSATSGSDREWEEDFLAAP